MAKKRRDRSAGDERRSARTRRLRLFSLGCGGLTAFGLVVLVAAQLLRVGPREHAHPPAPHGGKLAVLGRGDGHCHAEVVVEPSGAVWLYTLGTDVNQAVAADPLLLTAKARPAGAGEDYDFVFRPAPGAGAAGGQTTAFLGRLPGEAVAARVEIRVAALRLRGAAHDFTVVWESGRSDEEVRDAYEADQRRIYLTAGEKYTAADIAAAGHETASAKYRGRQPAHGGMPRVGERVCPITGLRAAEAMVWWVSGEKYAFCCQPCIDEFVTLAKDRPGEVRGPAEYVKKQ